MTAINTALGFLVSAASVVYPPAVPFLQFAQRIEPVAEAAFPLLKDAIAGGPAAFAAFKTAVPNFYVHLAGLAVALKTLKGGCPSRIVTVTDGEIAALGAHVAGIDPPGWVHEETVRWWDRDKASMG